MLRKRKPLTAAITTVWTMAAADAAATQLDTVTVTATRSERPLEEVAATVTARDRDELDRNPPADEADLFRNDLDVAYARDQRRFGATRPNIRGIEDNRVNQMVDGVRTPDWYNGGGAMPARPAVAHAP
jgi:hemoglobin/transferrin/lactoferrin receptor protein